MRISLKHLILFRLSDIIIVVIGMTINEILAERGMTKYRLAKLSGVPHSTLSEICSGKASIEKCSVETLYKISKVLKVSMESLIEDNKKNEKPTGYEEAYECGLPRYLQKDLDAYKEGLKTGSGFIWV